MMEARYTVWALDSAVGEGIVQQYSKGKVSQFGIAAHPPNTGTLTTVVAEATTMGYVRGIAL